MRYVGKNGFNEQVMFFRQQPRDMASAQFDFEEDEIRFKRAVIDAVLTVVIVLVIGGAFLYAYVVPR